MIRAALCNTYRVSISISSYIPGTTKIESVTIFFNKLVRSNREEIALGIIMLLKQNGILAILQPTMQLTGSNREASSGFNSLCPNDMYATTAPASTVLPFPACSIVYKRLPVAGIADINIRKAEERGGTAAAATAASGFLTHHIGYRIKVSHVTHPPIRTR